jgi:hypothetical protein
MNKRLEEWDNAYVESIDVTERTTLELKGSHCVENLGKTIGDVVSAFANFDGGHIIVGATNLQSSKTIVSDGLLDLRSKGRQGLKEWLETKIYRLSDPPVRSFDVKEFTLAGGNLAVIEIRPSDDAPHQDNETHLFYGRNGSLCYALSTTQIKDILQRQKAPILEIQQLRIKEGLAPDKGRHFILSFIVANVGKVVCQSHLVAIRIPLKFGSTLVGIDNQQHPFNGRVSDYVDTESQSAAYVVKIKGGKIYTSDGVTKALSILAGAHFDDRMDTLCSRTENKVSITVLSDPPSREAVEAQIPV